MPRYVTGVMLGFFACFATCAQVPHFYPRINLPGDGLSTSFWLQAPDILVVKVRSAEWVGPELEVLPRQRLVLRLVRVTAAVEDRVRGTVPIGDAQFFFFANTLSANGYHSVLGWLDPNGRYVVFLRHEEGALRTLADVSGFSIRLFSGEHSEAPVPQSDPGTAIALLALTPGQGVEAGFGADLPHRFGELARFTPAYRIAPLLRGLLSNADLQVREQACLTLSAEFAYRDPCLLALESALDPSVRAQANKWARLKSTTPALLRMLKDNPLDLSISGRVDDLLGDIGVLTWDSDAAVGVAACDALGRLSPSTKSERCPNRAR